MTVNRVIAIACKGNSGIFPLEVEEVAEGEEVRVEAETDVVVEAKVWLDVAVEEAAVDWAVVPPVPLEARGPNSRILLSGVSETQRLPEESNVTSIGPDNELWQVNCVNGHEVSIEVTFSLPIASVAFMNVEKGALNWRTLPPLLSVTQRFPPGSKAIP